MKVITHIACEIEPNNPEQGKILVEIDRYEFQALTSHGRHEGPDGRAMGIVSLPTTHNAASPGGATIEVDGVRYAEVGPAKPKDWRPPVGSNFQLRTDISDARGCLQQALKSLDAFYLIEPTKTRAERRDPTGLGRLLHDLALNPVKFTAHDPAEQDCADALGYLFRGLDLAEKVPGPVDLTAENMALLAEVTKDAIEHGTGIFETAVHIDKKGDIQFSVNRVPPPGAPLKADLAASAASAKDFSAKIGKAALKKPRKPAKKAQAKKKAPARKARR